MTPRSWFPPLFARKPRAARRAPARFRPRLEALEDRLVMSLTAPGYYSADGQEPGIPAPPGTYVAISGATAPTIDPLGYYTDQEASVAPIPAPLGMFVDVEGATSPTPAPPGYYTDQLASTAAKPAPLGSYVPVAGASAATLALPGSYVDTVGATSATLAPLGSFVAVAGASAATPAPPGSYVDTVGATAATLAPLGSYVPVSGASAPTLAPPGSYVATVGATAATLAPLGGYVPVAGASAPTLASPGFYVDTTGATAATPAPLGYYVPTAGATQPTPASPGYYVPYAGAAQQIANPPGTYSGFAATIYSPTNPGRTTGGQSLRFWGNKPGQALQTRTDLSALTGLNLRTASGARQDFRSSLAVDGKALRRWLLRAKATNMAYLLSAQLAAAVLNVRHGSVNANASVNVSLISSGFNTLGPSSALTEALNSGPNPRLVNQNGEIRIGALIDAANASLGVNARTKASSAVRRYQEALKDVLDAINNNQALILA
jgi:hypothetical protein